MEDDLHQANRRIQKMKMEHESTLFSFTTLKGSVELSVRILVGDQNPLKVVIFMFIQMMTINIFIRIAEDI